MNQRGQRMATRNRMSLRDQIYISEKEKTFQNDDSLPSLPLPSLRQTLDKYLDSVRPVVTEEEFGVTEKIVNEFYSGIGSELHGKLAEKAEKLKNWLEDWWLDYAYLKLRYPLIPYSNMAGPFPTLEYYPPQPGSRIDRMSLGLNIVMQFWKLIRSEKLRPMIHKNVPWAMDQFKRIFNSTRIPGEEKDTLVCSFKTASEGPPASTNVILLYRGYIFSFESLDRVTEEPYTPQEIAYQLYYIEKWCQAQQHDGPGIGALTVTDRTSWANNRNYLRNLHSDNIKSLNIIESALLVMVIDDSEPLSQKEVMEECLKGDCSNRWADKSLSNIFFKNGLSGGSNDHTPMDGLCSAIMTNYLLMSLNECKGIYKGVNRFRDMPKPELIEFFVDDKIVKEIQKAKDTFRQNCDDISISIYSFEDYGKSILVSHKFHPEAYIQVALQLAYYRMYGKPAPTYCTASTRKYYHGRTETCRSCTPESTDFAKAVIGSGSPGELYSLLQIAVKKFQQLMVDAMSNNGCDRHLLGLYITSLEENADLPEIFTDPSFFKSGGGGNYTLSTSCSGYWSMVGGVPPMKSDGYGCFYGIENNRITFCCTSYNSCPETNIEAFLNNVRLSLVDMQNILNSSKL